MTETPTTPPEAPEVPEARTVQGPAKGPKGVGALTSAPKDAPEESRTGYAVYDRVLGRYVSEVTAAKPSAKDASTAAKGHSYRIVAV